MAIEHWRKVDKEDQIAHNNYRWDVHHKWKCDGTTGSPDDIIRHSLFATIELVGKAGELCIPNTPEGAFFRNTMLEAFFQIRATVEHLYKKHVRPVVMNDLFLHCGKWHRVKTGSACRNILWYVPSYVGVPF